MLNPLLTTLSSQKGFSASFNALFTPWLSSHVSLLSRGPNSGALWLLPPHNLALLAFECFSSFGTFLRHEPAWFVFVSPPPTATFPHFLSGNVFFPPRLWVTRPDRYLREDGVSEKSGWFRGGGLPLRKQAGSGALTLRPALWAPSGSRRVRFWTSPAPRAERLLERGVALMPTRSPRGRGWVDRKVGGRAGRGRDFPAGARGQVGGAAHAGQRADRAARARGRAGGGRHQRSPERPQRVRSLHRRLSR